MISVNQLSLALNCNLGRASVWVEPLKGAMALHDISTPARMAAFLSQLSHESACFTRLSENLNYTPEALMATFNNSRIIRFTPVLANRYGRTKDHPADQKMIGSIAYAKRMGNGSIESQEGYIFRGRGPIQLTGKDNYYRCGKGINADLLTRPELLEKPEYGAQAAAWFWTEGNGRRNLNELADLGDIREISRVINGGFNGLADRIAQNNHMKTIFA